MSWAVCYTLTLNNGHKIRKSCLMPDHATAKDRAKLLMDGSSLTDIHIKQVEVVTNERKATGYV